MASFELNIKKFEGILAKYRANRMKGMNAGDIATKLNVPLKDVISLLIEKEILKGEQVDLELARVLLAKNQELRAGIWNRFGIESAVLDKALATQDRELWEEIWEQYRASEISPVFNSLVFSLFVLNIPYNILLAICAVLLSFFYKEFYVRAMPRSNVEIVLKIFEEV